MDYFVGVEGYAVDEVFLIFVDEGIISSLLDPSHHVLEYAHGVLIDGKLRKFIFGTGEEIEDEVERKLLYYFLDEMC